MTANANSIVQHEIHIQNGMMINTSVSVKIIVCVKKIIAGSLAHVFVRILGI